VKWQPLSSWSLPRSPWRLARNSPELGVAAGPLALRLKASSPASWRRHAVKAGRLDAGFTRRIPPPLLTRGRDSRVFPYGNPGTRLTPPRRR